MPGEAPAEGVDPVCGMTVAVGPATEQTVYEEVTVFFCSAHCKARFEEDPARYSGLRAP